MSATVRLRTSQPAHFDFVTLTIPPTVRQSDTSFHTERPDAMVAWLVSRGFEADASSSRWELARLRRNRDIAIIYSSGAVLFQGPRGQVLADRLAELAARSDD